MTLSLRGLTAIVAAAIIASAAAASAQTTDSTTNVPFAFTVGNKTLPRDVYRISRLPGHMDVVQIRGLRGGVIVMSQPEGPDRQDPSPRLVFHRYGDSYFLREIRMPGNVGLALPATRLERDAAEKVASNAAPEVVVIPTEQ
jgi:hypothetical protein